MCRMGHGLVQVDKIWSICLQDMVSTEDIFGIGRLFALDRLLSIFSENDLKIMFFF